MPSPLAESDKQPPALSIRQPWAELILLGQKSIEIRTWKTAYRGPLWLHTGQKRAPELDRQYGVRDPFTGGFVGRVMLTSVLPLDVDRWERWRERHRAEGAMPQGVYAWILREPTRFVRPVVAPGQMGLFFPDSCINQLLQQALEESEGGKAGS
jgi:activating signal cointegrator 1